MQTERLLILPNRARQRRAPSSARLLLQLGVNEPPLVGSTCSLTRRPLPSRQMDSVPGPATLRPNSHCFTFAGAAVAERLNCSPPTGENRVQSPTGSLPAFRKWRSCRTVPLVGDLPFPLTLAFRRCFILASFHPHRLSAPQLDSSLMFVFMPDAAASPAQLEACADVFEAPTTHARTCFHSREDLFVVAASGATNVALKQEVFCKHHESRRVWSYARKNPVKTFGRLFDTEVLRADEGEARRGWRSGAGMKVPGKRGIPDGIVRSDSHARKSKSGPAGNRTRFVQTCGMGKSRAQYCQGGHGVHILKSTETWQWPWVYPAAKLLVVRMYIAAVSLEDRSVLTGVCVARSKDTHELICLAVSTMDSPGSSLLPNEFRARKRYLRRDFTDTAHQRAETAGLSRSLNHDDVLVKVTRARSQTSSDEDLGKCGVGVIEASSRSLRQTSWTYTPEVERFIIPRVLVPAHRITVVFTLAFTAASTIVLFAGLPPPRSTEDIACRGRVFLGILRFQHPSIRPLLQFRYTHVCRKKLSEMCFPLHLLWFSRHAICNGFIVFIRDVGFLPALRNIRTSCKQRLAAVTHKKKKKPFVKMAVWPDHRTIMLSVANHRKAPRTAVLIRNEVPVTCGTPAVDLTLTDLCRVSRPPPRAWLGRRRVTDFHLSSCIRLVGWTPVGTPLPRSRREGAIRATLTRTPSASSLLRASRAVFPSLRQGGGATAAPPAAGHSNYADCTGAAACVTFPARPARWHLARPPELTRRHEPPSISINKDPSPGIRASPKCSTVPRAPSRTVGFTHRVSHLLVQTQQEHLVRSRTALHFAAEFSFFSEEEEAVTPASLTAIFLCHRYICRDLQQGRGAPVTQASLAAVSYSRDFQKACNQAASASFQKEGRVDSLIHAVFGTSWRMLANSSPSIVVADNQCALDVDNLCTRHKRRIDQTSPYTELTKACSKFAAQITPRSVSRRARKFSRSHPDKCRENRFGQVRLSSIYYINRERSGLTAYGSTHSFPRRSDTTVSHPIPSYERHRSLMRRADR
ncbi:hypothetical protein PR048_029406 [Dryococelus australis]|uniref:Uncharacterized protein n=1 Tax=Dryococelus australis TaxID=614101 RepID=A0ABQ9GD98_9NEOP|nr:hypothetical protein PR048_029406 [Dryococelus australis]